jgi:hypothetical protein
MGAQMTVTITESDFDKLHNMSMRWGKDWITQKGRFSDAPLFTWRMGYWMGKDWLPVMFCQTFLSSRGYESQTVWDNATLEYLILTNYESPSWIEEL